MPTFRDPCYCSFIASAVLQSPIQQFYPLMRFCFQQLGQSSASPLQSECPQLYLRMKILRGPINKTCSTLISSTFCKSVGLVWTFWFACPHRLVGTNFSRWDISRACSSQYFPQWFICPLFGTGFSKVGWTLPFRRTRSQFTSHRWWSMTGSYWWFLHHYHGQESFLLHI